MDIIRPQALRKGQTIGVMAPSGPVYEKYFKKAADSLHRQGYTLKIHFQTHEKSGPSAGTPEQKTEALHDLFRDNSVQAIIFAEGGDEAARILPHLDFNLIANNPKPVVGYSDNTAVLNAITTKTGLVTFHGPTIDRFGHPEKITEKQITHFFNILGAKAAKLPLEGSIILHEGKAQGKLVGGNLSALRDLIGTPYQPDFRGKILFIEDLKEDIDHLNRILIQMKLAGVFENINGLIVGSFEDIKDEGYNKFDTTFEQLIFKEIAHRTDMPVVIYAPFGHGKNFYALPIGMEATLNTSLHDNAASLQFNAPTAATMEESRMEEPRGKQVFLMPRLTQQQQQRQNPTGTAQQQEQQLNFGR